MGSLAAEECSEGLDSWGTAVGTAAFVIAFGIATGKMTSVEETASVEETTSVEGKAAG